MKSRGEAWEFVPSKCEGRDMVHHPKLELARQTLRQQVCVKCYMRPAASETIGPYVARSCESACPIFLSLPTLLRIDVQVKAPSLAKYETAMRDLVCQTCMASPTAGDYCVGQMTRTCPLSLYLREAIEALDKVTAINRPMPENVTVAVAPRAKAVNK